MGKYLLGCAGVLVLAIILLVVVVGATWADNYNKLVAGKQAVDAAWADVENQYQRRADLIPNLVNTVSGAANFEKSTLIEITNARASVGQVKIDPNQAPTDPAQLQKFEAAQNQLGSALSRLLVVSERYPDLKANQNFLDLQAQLEGTENRITTARHYFNQAVQSYNAAVQSFPGFIIAGFSGFTTRPYFQAKEGSDVPPVVNFNNSPTNANPTLVPAPTPAPAPAH
jgi:LemA protein